MATASIPEKGVTTTALARLRELLSVLSTRPLLREMAIFSVFTVLTAVMTWPWVTRLRTAAIDPGDPYLISWILWWDFHQTFHDPLHLFNANIFYPLTHTLAFTENNYGTALIFFPLFALGARPLTVTSVATLFGFAFSGYGAFRLTRTISGSTPAAWIAGIIFAFFPYHFHMFSQIQYLSTGWIPLTLEAFVLFARERTWKRATWLTVAFAMHGLTCISWFLLSLVPLGLTLIFLVIHHRLERDRRFWIRGLISIATAMGVLLPFFLPYYYVSKTYGFKWPREAVERNSATLLNWLMAEYRVRLWRGFGANLPAGSYRLFPGLLPLVLSAVALLIPGSRHVQPKTTAERERSVRWLVIGLDAGAAAAAVLAFLSAGWSTSVRILGVELFTYLTPDRALIFFVACLLVRLSVAYPSALRRLTQQANLVETIRSTQNEGVWVGVIWVVTGFLMSLGTNSWLFRVLFDFVFFFKAMREPSRAAMMAGLGLAILSGIGVVRLAAALRPHFGFREVTVVAVIIAALLFEFRVAPLRFIRGAVEADQLSLRLKETPMRGGIVELPTGGGELPHLYMLRAADHGRPLINAISTFVPPHSGQIDDLARQTPIPMKLLDALEAVPTSYLVIHNGLLQPERQPVMQTFLTNGLRSGRLRFINRFDGANDLYAIVKTEPDTRSEAALPFEPSLSEWAVAIQSDPANILSQFRRWSEALYRVKVVANGSLPRYAEFVNDARALGNGLVAGLDDKFQQKLSAYAQTVAESAQFKHAYDGLSPFDYVNRLLANGGVTETLPEATAWVNDLASGRETRASILLKVAGHPSVIAKQRSRSIVLLHYFAYLRRNPDDPPDGNMAGFNYWVAEVSKTGGDGSELARAFLESDEYQRKKSSDK